MALQTVQRHQRARVGCHAGSHSGLSCAFESYGICSTDCVPPLTAGVQHKLWLRICSSSRSTQKPAGPRQCDNTSVPVRPIPACHNQTQQSTDCPVAPKSAMASCAVDDVRRDHLQTAAPSGLARQLPHVKPQPILAALALPADPCRCIRSVHVQLLILPAASPASATPPSC